MTKYTRDLKVKKEKHSAVNNCDFFYISCNPKTTYEDIMKPSYATIHNIHNSEFQKSFFRSVLNNL